MTAPFVVFSLPRSRSAWLSVFLAWPNAIVGHDIGPTLAVPQEFAERLTELEGTCETGAAFAWRLIRQMLPEARFAVIRRDPAEVTHSLERFGLTGFGPEMQVRAAQLDEISAQPGTLTVQYADLASADACAALYEHCRGSRMPAVWWAHLDPINIQVDMARQVQRLTENHDQIETTKASARLMMADV